MTKYNYLKLSYLAQYAKAYYLKILFVSVTILAGLLIATSCKNKKTPGTAHQSESVLENNPEATSSLNISVNKSQLIDKQKKITVTITVPTSQIDTLKDFKLQVGFLDEPISDSEISYENQEGQKEVSKSIKKALTEFNGVGNKATSSKKQKGHAIPITLNLMPSKQANKLKLAIKLLDKQDQVLKTLEVKWIKSKLAVCNLEELVGETAGHFILKNLADTSLEPDKIEIELTGEKGIVCQFLRTGTSIARLRQLLPESMQLLSPDSDTCPIGLKVTSMPQGVKQAKVIIKVTQNEEKIILVTQKLTWNQAPKPTCPKPSKKQEKKQKQEKLKAPEQAQTKQYQEAPGKFNTSTTSNRSVKKTTTPTKSQKQKREQEDEQKKQEKTNTNPMNSSPIPKPEKEAKQTEQPSPTNSSADFKQEGLPEKQPQKEIKKTEQPNLTSSDQENIKQKRASEKQSGKEAKKREQPSFASDQRSLKQQGPSEKQPEKVKNKESTTQPQSNPVTKPPSGEFLKKPSSPIDPTKGVTDSFGQLNLEQVHNNLEQEEKPYQEIKATELENKKEPQLTKGQKRGSDNQEKPKKQEKEVSQKYIPDLQLRVQQKRNNDGTTSKKFDVFVKNNGGKLDRNALFDVKLRYTIQGEGNLAGAKLKQNRKQVVASGIEIFKLINSALEAGEEKKFELIVETGDAHSLSLELSLEGVKKTNTVLANWQNKQKTKQDRSKSNSAPDLELSLEERKNETNKLFKLVINNKGGKLTKKSLKNVKISYTLGGTGDLTDVKLTRRKRDRNNPDIQGETLDKLLKSVDKDQRKSFELIIYSANAHSLTFQISLLSLEGESYTKAVQVNWKRENKDQTYKKENY